MRIAISLPPTGARQAPWTGETIRSGGVGVSGTESTFVVFAEYWASQGHEVRIVGPDCADGSARGVKYISTKDFDNPEVLVMPVWDTWCAGLVFPELKFVIISFACATAPASDTFPDVPKIGIFPSDWARRTVYAQSPWLQSYLEATHVIPNPLLTVPVEPVPKLPRSFVWHTSWERGGEVALRAFQAAFGSDGRFAVMDYFTPSGKGSVDRATVCRNLAKAEYFVYPLVLPSTQVVKDTFACCVAEALAHGVIVISWRVAALPEVYRDAVQWIPTPSLAALTDHTAMAFDDHFASDQAVNDIVAIIKRLEADPDEKAAIRERGKQLAATFEPAVVCPLLDRVAPALCPGRKSGCV